MLTKFIYLRKILKKIINKNSLQLEIWIWETIARVRYSILYNSFRKLLYLINYANVYINKLIMQNYNNIENPFQNKIYENSYYCYHYSFIILMYFFKSYIILNKKKEIYFWLGTRPSLPRHILDFIKNSKSCS